MTETPAGTGYRWSSIGGHLALDLANTVSWRLDPARAIERLATPDDLIAWFAAVGDGPDRVGGAIGVAGAAGGGVDPDALRRQVRDDPAAAEAVLDAVHDLREAFARVAYADLGLTSVPGSSVPKVPAKKDKDERTDGRTEDAGPTSTSISADVDLIAAAWRSALAVATTEPSLPWRWRVTPTDLHALVPVLALAMTDLLHRPDSSDLRCCAGDGCGWLFLDTTRNHSRRWCDPQDCGNRARVRAYTERQRRAASGLRP